MPNSKVKPKAKLKHGDVIHAISSSGNKNVANNAISTVNKSARTSKVKRKAFPTKEHMEESSVNSCNGSNVTGNVEFEDSTTSDIEIERLGDYDGQAEVISLLNIKSIIDDYEFYFVKRPVTVVTNFYLKPMSASS
ncbi:9006_t:CDS:2, partial [Gigaspora rosea]